MVGLNKYDGKKRREQRRKNAIAKGLRTPKYKQRRVPDKKRKDRRSDYEEIYDDE